MNISNPGPVESWQEVLAEARDQITSATAVKARGGLPHATARLDLPAASKHA